MLVAQSGLILRNPMTVAGQATLEHWSGLPFPSPGDLPDSGIELVSPALQAVSLPSEPPGTHTSPGAWHLLSS